MGGVGIHAEEGVGVLLGDGGDVVDIKHLAAFAADRLGAHIVDTFGLDVGAEAFLGIGGVDHEGFAIAVDVFVHDAGVLSFASILGLKAPVAVGEVHTHGTSTHVEGEPELVGGVFGDDGRVVLVFAYETGTEGSAELAFGHGFDDAVEVDFAIDAANQAVAVAPEVALFADKGFDGDTVEGPQGYIKTP